MYPKYTTDAFIIGENASGEADKIISFFTRELGMIRALAKSVRMSKSKLNASLASGNFLSISLIKGKDIWRLTESEVKGSMPFPSEEMNFFLRILSLIKKMVHGEEANQPLFEVVEELFFALSSKNLKREFFPTAECVVVVRMLNILGYGREEGSWKEAGSWSMTEAGEPFSDEKCKNIIELINTSLKESHL